MAKQTLQADKDRITELAGEGKTDAEIAKALGWTNKTAARSVGNIRRAMGLKKAGIKLISKVAKPTTDLNISMDQMTKEDRFAYIHEKFARDPRTQFVLGVMGNEEKELFTSEYFSILKSTDSITEAEEQQLFTAMLEYVLAMRAYRMKTDEEKLYNESKRGQIPQFIIGPDGKQIVNHKFRATVNPRFEDEYNSHLKNYDKFMDALKMSRKQRLDRIKQDRKSLVDVAMELSSKDAQASAAGEIEKLDKLKDEELQKMIENGFIIGVFED